MSELDRIKITEDVLIENGFKPIRKPVYYVHKERCVVVKVILPKLGGRVFHNNLGRVKYMDQLSKQTKELYIDYKEKYKNNPGYKLKAFKGDALISFFAKELLCKSERLPQKINEINAAKMICSNDYLMEVCLSMGLCKKVGLEKGIGSLYEANIYEIFLQVGFDAAFKYFKDTVYHYYINKKK